MAQLAARLAATRRQQFAGGSSHYGRQQAHPRGQGEAPTARAMGRELRAAVRDRRAGWAVCFLWSRPTLLPTRGPVLLQQHLPKANRLGTVQVCGAGAADGRRLDLRRGQREVQGHCATHKSARCSDQANTLGLRGNSAGRSGSRWAIELLELSYILSCSAGVECGSSMATSEPRPYALTVLAGLLLARCWLARCSCVLDRWRTWLGSCDTAVMWLG